MNDKPMLHIVDMSYGFMNKNGSLYVNNAEKLVRPTNKFFNSIKHDQFDKALVTNDTHFKGEYQYSDESKLFPFHQGFGTQDHTYYVAAHTLGNKMPLYWMLKNKFDMWATHDNYEDKNSIQLSTVEEQVAYENLFHISIRDKDGYNFLEHRDIFFYNTRTRRVAIIGVATDYCVRDAIKGYLKRGFEVTLLEDLTQGIYDTNIPNGVSSLCELIRENFFDEMLSGQFLVLHSEEYLGRLPHR